MDSTATVNTTPLNGSLPWSSIQNRRFSCRATIPGRHRSLNHAIRANAKRLAHSPHPNQVFERTGLALAKPERDDLVRPQLEAELRRHWGCSRSSARMRCRSRPNAPCVRNEEDEGRDLASSEIPLPGDAFRLARRPTLGREDAFRDNTSSARGKVRLRRHSLDGDDAQVAELYSMGLLDDDEDDDDATAAASQDDRSFTLNSIRREQPVYSIRRDRRARRPSKTKSSGRDPPLQLEFSFSDLGDDTAIAQYLASPGGRSREFDDGAGPLLPRPLSEQAYPPLRVIYELAGSRPTFEVETSQPPDLVTDLVSDYDCFTESELDDMPQQHEVHEGGDEASGPWVMLGSDERSRG